MCWRKLFRKLCSLLKESRIMNRGQSGIYKRRYITKQTGELRVRTVALGRNGYFRLKYRCSRKWQNCLEPTSGTNADLLTSTLCCWCASRNETNLYYSILKLFNCSIRATCVVNVNDSYSFKVNKRPIKERIAVWYIAGNCFDLTFVKYLKH